MNNFSIGLDRRIGDSAEPLSWLSRRPNDPFLDAARALARDRRR